MKMLVLNGITEDEKYRGFEKAIEDNVRKNTQIEIDYFRLRDMNIKYCTGI